MSAASTVRGASWRPIGTSSTEERAFPGGRIGHLLHDPGRDRPWCAWLAGRFLSCHSEAHEARAAVEDAARDIHPTTATPGEHA